MARYCAPARGKVKFPHGPGRAPARVVGFDLAPSASDRSRRQRMNPQEEAHACGEGERLSP